MPDWVLHSLDPIRSVCGDWCLHFWEVVGIWFTGAATFAAVVVSLLLARREGVRLEVSARQMTMVGPGVEPPFPQMLFITVRNVGGRPVTIEGVGWSRRPWRSLQGYQLFNVAGYPGPPATIAPSNAHDFILPISQPEVQWGEWFVKHFVGSWPRLGVHLVRVIAYTPAGDRCSAFLDSSLKEWLIKKAQAMKVPQHAA